MPSAQYIPFLIPLSKVFVMEENQNAPIYSFLSTPFFLLLSFYSFLLLSLRFLTSSS